MNILKYPPVKTWIITSLLVLEKKWPDVTLAPTEICLDTNRLLGGGNKPENTEEAYAYIGKIPHW